MQNPDTPRLIITEEFRAAALEMLRELEPDNHLVDCPDAVVISGDAIPERPDSGGGTWYTIQLGIQCGHGHTSSRVSVSALTETAPPEWLKHGHHG